MIIPIRCFTCGKVLANKWTAYTKMIEEKEKEKEKEKEEEEVRPISPTKPLEKYFNRMCKFTENCKNKETCKFVHTEEELKVSRCQYGKKCRSVEKQDGKYENKKKSNKCFFLHPEETLTMYCNRNFQ